jgi:hypothetical protein
VDTPGALGERARRWIANLHKRSSKPRRLRGRRVLRSHQRMIPGCAGANSGPFRRAGGRVSWGERRRASSRRVPALEPTSWPRSRFSARGPGWPARPRRAGKWLVEMANASVSGRRGSPRRALDRPGTAQGITHGRAIHSPRTVGKNGNKWEFFGGLRSRSRDLGPPGVPASQAQWPLVVSS